VRFLFILWVCVASFSAQAKEPVIVVVSDFKFQPSEVVVTVGDTIRWENQEKFQYHSVWFELSGEEEPDYFFPEESYEKTFLEVGEFPYRCGPHPKMMGLVRVMAKGQNNE